MEEGKKKRKKRQDKEELEKTEERREEGETHGARERKITGGGDKE